MIRKIFLAFFLVFSVTATASSAPLCSFQGLVDLKSQKFEIAFDLGQESRVGFDFSRVSETNTRVNIRVEHVKTALFDLSTQLESTIQKIQESPNAQAFYQGTVWSRYSLLDYKPTAEIYGQFNTKDGKLTFDSLSWGDMTLEGSLGLHPPQEMNVTVKFSELKISDFFATMGCSGDYFSSSGLVAGEVRLSGPLKNPLIKGRVEGFEGFIQDLQYDRLILNFEGAYPLLNIVDSAVTQSEGLSFKMEGLFDLASRNCISAKNWIARFKTSPLIDEGSLHREWTIKRSQNEGALSSTEFKYRLKKIEDANPARKQESDLIGVEQKIAF